MKHKNPKFEKELPPKYVAQTPCKDAHWSAIPSEVQISSSNNNTHYCIHRVDCKKIEW